jgi:phosphopantetheine adenylyltransferase
MVRTPANIREYEQRKASEEYEKNRYRNQVDAYKTRITFLKECIVDLKDRRKRILKMPNPKLQKPLLKKQIYETKLVKTELKERKEQLKIARSNLKRFR